MPMTRKVMEFSQITATFDFKTKELMLQTNGGEEAGSMPFYLNQQAIGELLEALAGIGKEVSQR
jgi:hypothetical protein